MATEPNQFTAYDLELIAVAAHADTLISYRERVNFGDSFTSEMFDAITRDDDDVIECAFPDATDDELEEIDAETIREGIIERILDDIICSLPEGLALVWTEDGTPVIDVRDRS